MEITIMTGFFAKRDMKIQMLHGCGFAFTRRLHFLLDRHTCGFCRLHARALNGTEFDVANGKAKRLFRDPQE